MYKRNRIYINESNQEKIKNCRLLIAGAGLGSVISECALRLGFENLTIIDFDQVELSNLNRQNYVQHDIDKLKVEVLAKRLKSINPDATINYHSVCLGESNLEDYVQDFDIAINTIDFTSDAPFLFDNHCLLQNKLVLHPFNFGWAGCVFAIDSSSKRLIDIKGVSTDAEKAIVRFILSDSGNKINKKWLEEALYAYEMENTNDPPPQLAVASWITAGICTKVAYDYATGNKILTLPRFYFLSMG
jgi:molybdopterin-synthase adenylyltransferase